MLDPWIIKRSPIKKYIAKIWFENQNLRKAECIHALCVSEYNSIREYGLKNPVAIIPNGTTIPQWKRNYDLIDKKRKKHIIFKPFTSQKRCQRTYYCCKNYQRNISTIIN